MKWAARHMAAAQINSALAGRWDRNCTGNLRLWRKRRSIPDRPVQSYCAEYSAALTCVPSHTVPLRSLALLPFLLPPHRKPLLDYAASYDALRTTVVAVPGYLPECSRSEESAVEAGVHPSLSMVFVPRWGQFWGHKSISLAINWFLLD
jgi:hypothetical protein